MIIPEKVTYEGTEYTVTSIAYEAFCQCTEMTTVTLPSSITNVEARAFYLCNGLTKVFISDIDAWCHIDFKWDANPLMHAGHLYLNGKEIFDLVIPSSVTSIGRNFEGWNSLKSVVIPNNVKSIGESAFDCCTSLSTVTMTNSVTTIGDYAFRACSSLSSINISNSIKSIGLATFRNCTSLPSIEIPSGVTSIGKYAFADCNSLISVSFPNTITQIDNNAFEGCSSLLNVSIPNGVTEIAASTFEKCTSLTSVTLPNSLTSLGSSAFKECSSLTSIVIPDNVKTLGFYVFQKCRSLSSVSMPIGITTIGFNAFADCYLIKKVYIKDIASWCNVKFDSYESSPLRGANLYLDNKVVDDLIIPNNVLKISDYVFAGCSSLKSVVISNSVTSIGESAFKNCSNIVSLSLPESLKMIKQAAFSNCSSLKNLILPSNLEYIYQNAFYNCGFIEIWIKAITPPFAYENSFSNYNIPLYVPNNSISSYCETSPWNKFIEVKSQDGGNPSLKCATPTIEYKSGKLTFKCNTDGAKCHSTIEDKDIKSYEDNEVQLDVTYCISVYATKDGYQNSETATATLCWIDVEPKTEGITDGIVQMAARAVMVKAEDGQLTVEGADDNTNISVYTIDGVQVGTSTSRNGIALINTSISKNSVVIVKIGNKSVKVMMK